MYSVRATSEGLFYIRHPKHPGLAWSHEAGAWVRHTDAHALDAFGVIRFETEEAADDFATDNYLYPKRD
jgi:hypothetical protein